MTASQASNAADARPGSVREVFRAFLLLGLTSFGGPVAHLGYYRTEFVARRRWLDEATYADIVALNQFLPGPTSSQTGFAIGLLRAGLPGALAAWIGFTLPSAVAMLLLGTGLVAAGGFDIAWLSGLKIAALAIVAQAVWAMAVQLCPNRRTQGFALVAAMIMLVAGDAAVQIAVIALAAVAGHVLLENAGGTAEDHVMGHRRLPATVPVLSAVLLVLLLGGLPVAALALMHPALDLVDAFLRAGALVFGGGHVVLPLLQSEMVSPGYISADAFLAGYGAAQALPGPLFTIAGFLGSAIELPGWPGGIAGGVIALVAIFAPGFLLLLVVWPFWQGLRRRHGIRRALAGVNAAVVGLLLAALYDPIWTSTVHGPLDLAMALGALTLLAVARVPPWAVVVLCLAAGAAPAALA
ncbi:MAG: chromate efflux transporter [Alphaproteobacteria bacterium]